MKIIKHVMAPVPPETYTIELSREEMRALVAVGGMAATVSGVVSRDYATNGGFSNPPSRDEIQKTLCQFWGPHVNLLTL